MTSTIIECRQLNSDTKVYNNGDFTTTINNNDNMVINENDQIFIRNAFIDTVPVSNQYIELLEDTTLTADFYYYTYNYSSAGKPRVPYFAYQGYDGTTFPTKEGQSLCGDTNGEICTLTIQQNVDANIYGLMHSFEVWQGDFPGHIGWGDIPFIIEYNSFNNVQHYYHGHIPYIPEGDKVFTVPLPDILANRNLQTIGIIINSVDLARGNLYLKPNYTSSIVFKDVNYLGGQLKAFIPILGTKSGIIPKGKYAPQEIASRVSKIFQEATPTGPYDTSTTNSLLIPSGPDNPEHRFVMNLNDHIYSEICITGETPPVYNDVFIEPTTGLRFCSYITMFNYNLPTNTLPYWTGSSQFDFQYDNQSNKFFFEYLHTPYYATAVAGVQTPEILTISANNYVAHSPYPIDAYQKCNFYTKAHSGIVFTSLRSSPTGFWDKICGFDLTAITVSPTYQILTVNPTEFYVELEPSYFPYIPYEESKNITAPFIVNDMSISKTATFAQKPAVVVGEQLEVVGVNSIYANNTILNNVNENAYYLIEVNSNFKNNLLTSDLGNMKNVTAIANTFFNSSSFTSTNSSDSFVYTHVGEPLILSSFNIRILDSSKKLATGLGSDNTIFLQIVQQPKIPPQITDNEETKQIKASLAEQNRMKKN